MKIVIIDAVDLLPDHIDALRKYGEVVVYHDIPSEDEGIKRVADADIIIAAWLDMSPRLISSGKKLKLIVAATTGTDWIDLRAARDHEVIVSNAPGYGTEAVAEHTISLMLQAARKAYMVGKQLREGKRDPAQYRGVELAGKTLGIVGFGRIGRRVGEIARKGFGMKVLHTDSKSASNAFEILLAESDFISINASLNDLSRGLIGKSEFDMMKKGVVIVNTGRGAILDETELFIHLQNHKIFAVGLDVLSQEPMDLSSPLFTLENVVISPHIGFNTEEAKVRQSAIVLENVKAFIEGKPQNVVS